MTKQGPRPDPPATQRRAGKFPDHRGMATWGNRVVELDEFVCAVEARGRRLDPAQRTEALREFLRGSLDETPVEGPYNRVAVFGGVYSNFVALEALLEDARKREVDALYCLGDLGGFGPHPERCWPLLEQGEVRTIQGNYEQSLASGAEDCNCGYTDPRDNRFADLSFAYTASNTSPEFKRWMGELPPRRRMRVGSHELLLVHGSPRKVNEFLFYSTTASAYLDLLLEQERCDGFLCSHTGLHWHRRLDRGHVVNVGALGRPANDGSQRVWYAILEQHAEDLRVEFVSLRYDHVALAGEMQRESLPDEFVETILTGWWTTCLEVLPARERSCSRF